MPRLVYRGGSLTDDNFTPRPDRDITSRPGQSVGLSVFTRIEAATTPGGKVQVIDLDLLQPPLKAFPDELESEFGVEGHIAIAPVTIENDKIIDEALLREWAVTRKTGAAHFLTVALHNAVVHVDLRRPR